MSNVEYELRRPETSEKELNEIDALLGKDLRIKLDAQFAAMENSAYNAGVRDAREQHRNPNYVMGLRRGAQAADAPATPQRKTVTQLAARARELQIDAERNGKTITNAAACKMAYEEAGIPI